MSTTLPERSRKPDAVLRRIHLTNVVPSLWRSNVAEMWYCVPRLYGAIVLSVWVEEEVEAPVPARSRLASPPCDHVSVK